MVRAQRDHSKHVWRLGGTVNFCALSGCLCRVLTEGPLCARLPVPEKALLVKGKTESLWKRKGWNELHWCSVTKAYDSPKFFQKNDDAFVVHIFSRQRRPLWLRVCPQPANQNFCWRQPGSLVTSHDFTDVQRTCSDPAWFLGFKSPFAAPR